MKSSVVCVLALIALVNGEAGIHVKSNYGTQLEDASPYKRLLRTRSIESPQVCEPGISRMDDCNSCFCIGDGSGWACTKMECYHDPISVANNPEAATTSTIQSNSNNPSRRLKREETQVETCVPGSVKNVDCNSCFCSEAGWACTEIGCLHLSDFVPSNTQGEKTER